MNTIVASETDDVDGSDDDDDDDDSDDNRDGGGEHDEGFSDGQIDEAELIDDRKFLLKQFENTELDESHCLICQYCYLIIIKGDQRTMWPFLKQPLISSGEEA